MFIGDKKKWIQFYNGFWDEYSREDRCSQEKKVGYAFSFSLHSNQIATKAVKAGEQWFVVDYVRWVPVDIYPKSHWCGPRWRQLLLSVICVFHYSFECRLCVFNEHYLPLHSSAGRGDKSQTNVDSKWICKLRLRPGSPHFQPSMTWSLHFEGFTGHNPVNVTFPTLPDHQHYHLPAIFACSFSIHLNL